MEDGRVIDCGRHDDLIERCGLYQRLAAIQFGEKNKAAHNVTSLDEVETV